ncbi:MAG: AMP-binding protein, partial [Phenylobacterium sp.]|nr:AMP-binding protein [Phenylobacterium sp.]
HDIDEPVVAYSVAPLFHTGGRGTIAASILHRRHVVFRERFSGSQFWSDIERYGCNFAGLMAAFLAFLGQAGLPEGFRGSPLRYVGTGRIPENFRPIARRLGLKFSTVFNMTEISPPIASRGWLDELDGSCGHLREGYHCRIVDDHDREVPDGEPGELILRADEPFVLNQGYWRRPEDTVRAWRNLWFHTGDLFRRAPDGAYVFLERKDDRIRRRGENISSEEIENVALRHPDIEACSAVGVRSQLWDDDIKLVALLRPGRVLDPPALHAFMAAAMPAFMVPRYIELVDEIPRTPTGKAKRAVLRQAGVTPDTWDAAGGRRGA